MAERCSADNDRKITGQYAALLRNHIKLDKVILYGSFAKGQPHIDSDIDVAVVSSDFTGDRLEEQLKQMCGGYGCEEYWCFGLKKVCECGMMPFPASLQTRP